MNQSISEQIKKEAEFEEICAVCGGTRGLHNNMNQACPKDINDSRDHTEYRKTVFASIKTSSETLAETILDRILTLQDIQKSDGGSTGVNRKDIVKEIEDCLAGASFRESLAGKEGEFAVWVAKEGWQFDKNENIWERHVLQVGSYNKFEKKFATTVGLYSEFIKVFPESPMKSEGAEEDDYLKSLRKSMAHFKKQGKGEFAAGILLAINRYKALTSRPVN